MSTTPTTTTETTETTETISSDNVDTDDAARTFVLDGNSLVAGCTTITFIRTLRVSDSGTNALPPGFGTFTLRAVDPTDMRLPAHIRERGGVMLPIHQHEAMWMSFSADRYNPVALQIGAGGRCAVTGSAISDSLTQDPQNYVVLPKQPWLDGFKTADGKVRQFVAVALGSGHTVEKQLTGQETVGGLQLQVRELEENARRALAERLREEKQAAGMFAGTMPSSIVSDVDMDLGAGIVYCCLSSPMGLGAGGEIVQEIFADAHRIDDWSTEPLDKVWIHLVAATDWPALTGEPVPTSPISLDDYVKAGLPWFDYIDAHATDVATTPEMSNLKSIHELGGIEGIEPVVTVDSPGVRVLGPDSLHRGTWTWTGESI